MGETCSEVEQDQDESEFSNCFVFFLFRLCFSNDIMALMSKTRL